MSLLDGILAQVNSNVDVQNMAAKIGITPDQAESAIMALARSHVEQGDTIENAAASTGLGSDVLNQIVGHIGGEGSLGEFANLLHGDAGQGILGKLGGLASGLFGSKG